MTYAGDAAGLEIERLADRSRTVDFIDPRKCDSTPFWVDDRTTHEQIVFKCLKLLSSGGHL